MRVARSSPHVGARVASRCRPDALSATDATPARRRRTVLPRSLRMRSSAEFRAAVRGSRAGRGTLVVHASRSGTGTHVGFVVSKAVGDAVTRNRVKRRLRHLAAACLPDTPPGTAVVVRALPRANTHPQEVADDLRASWVRAVRRLPAGGSS